MQYQLKINKLLFHICLHSIFLIYKIKLCETYYLNFFLYI